MPCKNRSASKPNRFNARISDIDALTLDSIHPKRSRAFRVVMDYYREGHPDLQIKVTVAQVAPEA